MKKRVISIVLLITMLVGLMSTMSISNAADIQQYAATEFEGGSGTEVDPYLISTKEQLDNVRDNLDAHFKLTNDIDFDGSEFTPIGTATNKFTGTFDGNGFAIKNVNISAETSTQVMAGVFCYSAGTVKNLGIDGGTITLAALSTSGDIAGAVVGWNDGVVDNCYNTATVMGEYTGGIVGTNQGTVSNCYNSGEIKDFDGATRTNNGGIVGWNNSSNAVVTKCYNYGDITSVDHAGGIAGWNANVIEQCYNLGTIMSSVDAGGISAYENGTVTDCYNAGTIAGRFTGGVVGYLSSGAVENCYNVGDVTGTQAVGGIADAVSRATITNCYYLDSCLNDVTATEGGTAYSDDQFKAQETFAGFDFENVWEFNDEISYNYPVLKSVSHVVFENTVEFAGGFGTSESPYLVSTKEHLNNARNYLNAHFKLTNDIVFDDADFEENGAFYNKGYGWKPIGTTSETTFTGTFDGNGFAVDNLYINTTEVFSQYAGLFGFNSGLVENLGLTNSYIKGNQTVAGIVGNNSGTVKYCYNTSTIYAKGTSGTLAAGGVVGYNSRFIDCCYNTGDIIAENPNEYSSASARAGGIAGVDVGTSITNCYNAGKVSVIGPFGTAGGISGSESYSRTYYCYNVGLVSASSEKSYVGAITGGLYGKIANCFYLDNVSKGTNVHRPEVAVDGSVKCTADQLKVQETFADFDFENIWEFDSDSMYKYPVLQAVKHIITTIDFELGTNLTGTLDSETGHLVISGEGDWDNSAVISSDIKAFIKTVEISDGVTSIANNAFQDCANLVSVDIPESVLTIGDYAFDNSGLVTVDIPNGVTTLGKNVFSNCKSLTAATLADSITTIGISTFQNCYELESVTLPSNLTKISGLMFYNCNSLAAVDIPDTVTSIGDWAFYFVRIKNIDLPEGLVSIGSSAFRGCSIESIVIPDSVTEIGNDVFWGCSSMKSVTLPKNIDEISTSLLRACTSLTSVVIPEGVTYISNFAFYDCNKLKTLTLPVSLKTVCLETFENCTFSDIYYGGSNLQYKKIANAPYATNMHYAFMEYMVGENITAKFDDTTGTLTLSGTGDMPDYSTSSEQPWYSFNSKIKSVVIEEGITSIGDRAFYGLRYLESISIADSVKSIGANSFYDCDKMTSINIPSGVTTIGNYAFYYCIALKSIDIPDSVVTIGEYAFKACNGLETITFGNGLKTIGKNAFENCKTLKSVVIPDSVTTIGASAFSSCIALESVTLSNSLTIIPIAAFSGCSALESVVIPDSVTTIEGNAFKNCTSLTTLTIPLETTTIISGSFYGHALTDIYYAGSESMYKKMTYAPTAPNMHYALEEFVLGENLAAIWDASASKLVISGEGAWTVGAMLPAHIRPLIKTVEIESGVTSIASYSFIACEAIESVTIPESVSEIGDYAFYGCDDILNIYYSGDAHTYKSIANAPIAKNMNYNVETEHIFEAVAEKAATCTEDGYSSHNVCTVCGHIEGKTVYEATGHSFTTKQSDKQAENGKYYVQCDNCDEISDSVTVGKDCVTNEQTGENYASLEDAIANAMPGETVKLTDDVTAKNVTIIPGVTLDLNGYNLTSEYFVGLQGSNVIDTDVNMDGRITVAKNNVVLSKNNEYISVYDDVNKCYLFQSVSLVSSAGNDRWSFNADTYTYEVVPRFGGTTGTGRNDYHAMFADGGATTGVDYVIRVAWTDPNGTYTATQDFKYTEEIVATYFKTTSYTGKSFLAEFTGQDHHNAAELTIYTVVKSCTGVEILSRPKVHTK